MEIPTLSILMPNYNHARFIPQSLQAILDQSWPASEIIFIDDGSTDDSLDVVSRYAEQHSVIRLIRNEKNRGVNYNMARALEMATGDYVAGAACDDRVLPGFFEKSLGLLARHPQAGLCSGFSRVMDERGNDRGVLSAFVVTDEPAFIPPERAGRLLRTIGNWMQGNTTIYRRAALLEAGGFIPELESFSDNFISQVIALRYGACFIPEPLGTWRRMESTYSARCMNDQRVRGEVVRHTTALMATRYRDAFPQGYEQVWEREMTFEADLLTSRNRLARRGRVSRMLATCYLLAKHRPPHTLRRWLIKAVTRKNFIRVR